MKIKVLSSSFFYLIVFIIGGAYSEEYCSHFKAQNPQGVQKRHYAPDRQVDVLHLKLEVTPDYKNRTVAGKTTLTFVPIAKPVKTLILHAVDLTIPQIEATVPLTGYQVQGEEIQITFKTPILPGKEISVTITHEAEPQHGLYFRTPAMGYLPEDIHIWTQGEMHEARHWFPSFDYPNDRFTTEIICHVPPEMDVFSNGRRMGETFHEKTGLKAVRWLQDKPHVNYLIALVAGKFKKIEGKYRDIPLRFYTPTSQINFAKNSFRETAAIFEFFEKELGVPYPWAKYDQIVVDDFTWGGMENTTLTILTDRTLFTDETENIKTSQGLVAHELAHQWFGDYITCKDWSHIWLNEGFATFYPKLFAEHTQGRDEMLYMLYKDAKRITQTKDDIVPIVMNRFENMGQIFTFRPYQKGSWVLHMIRTQLGPDLYRKCIHQYLKQHALKSTVTPDIIKIFEEVSGLSFQQFFDQWMYHGGTPKLYLTQSWDEETKYAKITVKQTHKTSDKILTFRIPSKLRFKTNKGISEHPILIEEKEHEFFVKLDSKPHYVRFDPDYGTLAEVEFKKPQAMLYLQLEETKDLIGRLLAIEALKKKKGLKTIAAFKKALQNDPFYGVRIEASKALRHINSKASFEALAESLKQSNARVRLQVTQDIGAFYSEETLFYLERILKVEKNPTILEAAIKSLGKFPYVKVQKIIRHYLPSNSFRNVLVAAAIHAIQVNDHPDFSGQLQQTLQEREKELTAYTFAQGLNTLGHIGRHLSDRSAIRNFLINYINHPRRGIKIAAFQALGKLKDPKSIPILEANNVGEDRDPFKQAASEALKAINKKEALPSDLNKIRKQMLELKKENEKMQQELAQMKRRLEKK